MRSTRYHVDRVRYWLTDAVGGGSLIPDKVYMVPSRPKSKVYNCFIKLSGFYAKLPLITKKRPWRSQPQSKTARNEVRIL